MSNRKTASRPLWWLAAVFALAASITMLFLVDGGVAVRDRGADSLATQGEEGNGGRKKSDDIGTQRLTLPGDPHPERITGVDDDAIASSTECRIVGIVLSEAGMPIVGASVAASLDQTVVREWLLAAIEGQAPLPGPALSSTDTTAGGSFELIVQSVKDTKGEAATVTVAVTHAAFLPHVGVVELSTKDSSVSASLILYTASVLAGRTIDAEEHGVAGVRLTWRPDRAGRAVFGGYPVWLRGALETTTTQGDGAFSLRHVPPGSGVLVADHEDYLPAQIELSIPAEGRQDVRALLRAAAESSVHVTDVRGTPVTGIEVIALLESGWVNEQYEEQVTKARLQVVARTGDDGVARLRGLAEGTYSLHTVERGHPWTRRYGVLLPADDVRLTIGDSPTVHLAVHDSSGKPIESVSVACTLPDLPNGGPTSSWHFVVTEMDPTMPGMVRIDGVGDEGADVVVTAPGYGAARTQIPGLSSEAVYTGSVVLPRLTSISGLVVDQAGLPVGGARVQVAGGVENAFPTKATDSDAADGSFMFDAVPPGMVRLWASAYYGATSETVTTELVEEGSVSVLMQLDMGGMIAGEVTGRVEWLPLERLEVRGGLQSDASVERAHPADLGLFSTIVGSGDLPNSFQAPVSSNGTFTSPAVRPGRYAVAVMPAGGVDGQSLAGVASDGMSVDVVRGETSQVELSLPPLSAIDGHVPWFAGSNTLATARVVAFRHTADGWSLDATTQTSENGHFLLAPLRSGRYVIAAYATDGVGLSLSPQFQLAAGEKRYHEFAVGLCAVRGKVVDCESGAPVGSITARLRLKSVPGTVDSAESEISKLAVDLLQSEMGRIDVDVDSSGQFTVRGLHTGEYVVHAFGGEWIRGNWGTVSFANSNAEPVEVCVRLGAMVYGEVSTASGAAPDEVYAELYSHERSGLVASTSVERGLFELNGVDPGTYEFRLKDLAHGGQTLFAEELVLQRGERRRLDVQVGVE